MIHIAIFLSGSGSNTEKICHYFNNHKSIKISYLLSNKETSGAKRIGEKFNIPYLIFNRELYKNGSIAHFLQEQKIDVVILAGFLWLIPQDILKIYKDKVINIHPALLPKYGGIGMHGAHVHQAVFENKETESGITIHLCNEEYDKGDYLFQAKVKLEPTDTPDEIAKKVLALEHNYFPKVIEDFCLKLKS